MSQKLLCTLLPEEVSVRPIPDFATNKQLFNVKRAQDDARWRSLIFSKAVTMIIITAITIRYHESSFSSLKRVCLALKEELHLASHNRCIWPRQSWHGDGSQLNLPAADPLALVEATSCGHYHPGLERPQRDPEGARFYSFSVVQPPATASHQPLPTRGPALCNNIRIPERI